MIKKFPRPTGVNLRNYRSRLNTLRMAYVPYDELRKLSIREMEDLRMDIDNDMELFKIMDKFLRDEIKRKS